MTPAYIDIFLYLISVFVIMPFVEKVLKRNLQKTKLSHNVRIRKFYKRFIYIIRFFVILGAIFLLIHQFILKPINTVNHSAIVSSSANVWKYFSSTEGNFKIKFPNGAPKKITDEYHPTLSASYLKYRLLQYFENDVNGDLYWVEVNAYPENYGLINSYNSLSNYENSIKENLKNSSDSASLISSNQDTFKGNPSINLVFKSKNYYYKYRIFAIGEYAYGIVSVSTNRDFPQFEKFANSFEILNSNSSLAPIVAPAINPAPVFLTGNKEQDISALQATLSKLQNGKSGWQESYGDPKYSKADLDKLIDLYSREIAFCETLILNLQTGKGSVADNTSLLNAIGDMANQSDTIANRLNGK
jgi:hypothetical protein